MFCSVLYDERARIRLANEPVNHDVVLSFSMLIGCGIDENCVFGRWNAARFGIIRDVFARADPSSIERILLVYVVFLLLRRRVLRHSSSKTGLLSSGKAADGTGLLVTSRLRSGTRSVY